MTYQEKVIDPVINLLYDNYENLSKSQVIKTLAILKNLYYVGRVAWGTEGMLHDFSKIDIDDDYDSCELPFHDVLTGSVSFDYANIPSHYIDRYESSTYDTFKALVKSNVKFEQWELDQLKTDNTCNEWVQILVAESGIENIERHKDDMLFRTHNDFYWKNGYLVRKIAQYGLWQNVELPQSIQSHFSSLLKNDMIKKSYNAFEEYKTEQAEREILASERMRSLIKEMKKKYPKKYLEARTKKYNWLYSDITTNSLAYTAKYNNAHESYITTIKEMCRSVLNSEELDKQFESTINFAKLYK